jgi:hypothetical protein
VGPICRCCCAPLMWCHPPGCSIAIDAHNPPYEQVLIGVGWVSAPSVVGLSPRTASHCHPAGAGSVVPCHHRQAAPAIPPYEQLLVGMGAGAMSSAAVLSSGEGGGGIVSMTWQVNKGVVYLPGGSHCHPLFHCHRPSLPLLFVVCHSCHAS